MLLVLWIVLSALAVPGGLACDCSGNELGPMFGDASLSDGDPLSRGGLEDVVSPQLLQTYIALQLQKIGEDIASMSRAQDRAASQACGGGGGGTRPLPLRRTRRLAPLRDDNSKDVPVVTGIFEGLPRALRTTSTSNLAALKKSDESDVPVFKGTPDNSQVRLIRPTPATARVVAPAVPVVKGSADPAHPTRPSSSSSRRVGIGGGLQLSPEEEQALAVLMEGRHRGPSSTPSVSGVISGKVGGRAQQDRSKQSRPLAPSPSPSAQPAGQDCCTQRKLLAELERQLALLRRLNADHMREEEWARANTLPGSYPSPYFPYLHNLPIHPARGMDDSTYYAFPARPNASPSSARGTLYFMPVAGAQGSHPQGLPGVMVRPRGATGWRALGVGAPMGPRVAAPQDSWGCAETASTRAPASVARVDDKVKFGDGQKSNQEVERASFTQPDDSVDAKLGDPVDVEI